MDPVLLGAAGCIMACVIMRGEMERKGVWNKVFLSPSGRHVLLRHSPRTMTLWCLYYHPTAVRLVQYCFLRLLSFAARVAK